MDKKTNTSRHTMSLFALIMVSSAITTSVRCLPTIAETGFHMLFFAVIAAACFFIPVALASAELATGWPKKGGIYIWVREAFGSQLGFVAAWLQWNYMIIGLISMLYFVGGSLAFVIDPALAHSKLFLIIISLFVVWFFTFMNMKGLKMSSLICSVGFMVGVVTPGLLIIALGVIYLLQGNPVHISFALTQGNLLPNFRDIATLVLVIGFIRAFTGVEVSSNHASNVKNPCRNYPIAIFIVCALNVLINVLGSLSIAVVVPQKQISLVSGIMYAFQIFLSKFHLHWLVPILGVMLVMGAIGGISAWLIGPVKGLLATAESGELPPCLQTVNKHGVPTTLVIIQAIVISIVTSVLMLMPNINIAFWFSVALAVMIYAVMYSLMLLSVIRLRYKAADVPRSYKMPFGKIGLWGISGLGILTMIVTIIVGFFPPVELQSGSHTVYVFGLIFGVTVCLALPFIIYQFRKPEWKKELV